MDLFTNSSTRRRWHKLKIYAAADSRGLRPDRRGNGRFCKLLVQKQAKKGDWWNAIVTLRSWTSKVVAKATGPIKAQFFQGVDTTFRTKPALKTIENWSRIERDKALEYPLGEEKWNLQLRCPKMLPRAVFRRPWEPLRGAWGCPRGSQVWAKSKLGVFF